MIIVHISYAISHTHTSHASINQLPYILAYKSQNLRPNLDQKVGRATYMWVLHDSPGDMGSHFPSAHLVVNGAVAWGRCVDAHTANCLTTGRRRLPSPLQSIDGVCSLFLSLPWSASLSVERGESHSPSLLSANMPNCC